jgi:hypothetical protein
MATEESKQIFCWGEIYVSRAGDPFHAGDKALMRETPTQRGRVNSYDDSVNNVILFYPAIGLFFVIINGLK